jgi:perosamine synthetase
MEASPKYMPTNLAASLGCAQFSRINELVDKKRAIFFEYKKQLKDFIDLRFNIENEDIFNGVWATTIIIGKSYNIEKAEMIKRLADLGIPARPFFYPLSSMPAYEGFGTGSEVKNPVSYELSNRGITLSCSYDLSHQQILQITEAIKLVLRKKDRGYKT